MRIPCSRTGFSCTSLREERLMWRENAEKPYIPSPDELQRLERLDQLLRNNPALQQATGLRINRAQNVIHNAHEAPAAITQFARQQNIPPNYTIYQQRLPQSMPRIQRPDFKAEAQAFFRKFIDLNNRTTSLNDPNSMKEIIQVMSQIKGEHDALRGHLNVIENNCRALGKTRRINRRAGSMFSRVAPPLFAERDQLRPQCLALSARLADYTRLFRENFGVPFTLWRESVDPQFAQEMQEYHANNQANAERDAQEFAANRNEKKRQDALFANRGNNMASIGGVSAAQAAQTRYAMSNLPS